MNIPMVQSAIGFDERILDHSRTLWIGDLDSWMDESYLLSIFSHIGQLRQVKVIRDKLTGLSSGYGFVEFSDHYAAQHALDTLNGKPLPNGYGRIYRLNWATYGINERRPDGVAEYSLFVGDLSPEVNDYMLQQAFMERYPSVRSAKVVTDPNTGLSRRYGFVRFSDENEMDRALNEMQGQYCGSRPMRINHATPKRAEGQTAINQIPQGEDPTNTTVFIGGLDPSITEEDLREAFSPFGEIIYIKIPIGKGCGFVQFVHRVSAEQAIAQRNQTLLGRQRVRLSWGRSAKMASQNPQQPLQQIGNNMNNFPFQPQNFQAQAFFQQHQQQQQQPFFHPEGINSNQFFGAQSNMMQHHSQQPREAMTSLITRPQAYFQSKRSDFSKEVDADEFNDAFITKWAENLLNSVDTTPEPEYRSFVPLY